MGDELKELLKEGGGRIFKFGTPTSHTACSDSAMLFCPVLAYAKHSVCLQLFNSPSCCTASSVLLV